MPKLNKVTPLRRSRRTGKLICRCGQGYASEIDHLCLACRGGVSAMDALFKRLEKEEPRLKGFRDEV